jgi:hypothetical protein
MVLRCADWEGVTDDTGEINYETKGKGHSNLTLLKPMTLEKKCYCK